MKTKSSRVSETKSWLFEKINKIDKPLARLAKKKKGKRYKVSISEMKQDTAVDSANIKRIIQEYCE